MSKFFRKHLRTAAAIWVVALVEAPWVDAKIPHTTLQDLVKGSDLVLYGETIQDPGSPASDDTIIWFKVKALSKRPSKLPSGNVPICDEIAFRDTIDLRKYPGLESRWILLRKALRGSWLAL